MSFTQNSKNTVGRNFKWIPVLEVRVSTILIYSNHSLAWLNSHMGDKSKESGTANLLIIFYNTCLIYAISSISLLALYTA